MKMVYKVSKKSLKEGMYIEKEHLPFYRQMKKDFKRTGKCPSDEKFTEGIAKVHISEDSNYYTKLKKAKL